MPQFDYRQQGGGLEGGRLGGGKGGPWWEAPTVGMMVLPECWPWGWDTWFEMGPVGLDLTWGTREKEFDF